MAHRTYKYTPEQWEEILQRREQEDRDTRIAYAEDMDNWSALRQAQETEPMHFDYRRKVIT